MYVIPQYQPEVRIIGNDGSVLVYTNYQEFIENTSYYFVERNVVTTFGDLPVEWVIRWLGVVNKPPRYILRDVLGNVFSVSEILHDIRAHTISIYREEYNRKYDFVFRATPVPYTGKPRWRFENYYKKPKTTQERRWSCAHGDYVRGKRRSHMLPSVWDDIVRGDADSRKCWKSKKKKKQWM